MKKFNLQIVSILCLSITTLIFTGELRAQDARVQWIHNSADPLLGTVDIYLDGNKIKDDFVFRTATELSTVAAGTYTLNINAASSADSGDQVLERFNITFTANQNNVVLLSGVTDPLSFATNPDGRNTSLQLIQRTGVLLATSSNNTLALTVVHGITDAPGLNIVTRPVTSALNLSKVKYGDTTGNLFPTSAQTYIDVKDSNGTAIIKSYTVPFNLYARKSLVIFASGFSDPVTNQNGSSFSLFAADTNGVVTELTEAARLQLINNSPDQALDTIDVWLNTTKIASQLAFTRAIATTTILAGTQDVTITRGNSPDTATNVIYRLSGFNFQTGKNYLGIVTGVTDTTLYPVNPDGVDRSIEIKFFDNYAEAASTPTSVNTYFYNGVPDAPAFSIDINPVSPTQILAPAVFKATPASTTFTNALQIILEKVGSNINETYRLNLVGQGGKAGVLFTTGIYDTTGITVPVESYKYYMAFADGNVISLSSLTSSIQFVHASADASIKHVDLFINGVKAVDSFEFRSATPFLPLTAYKSYRLVLTPAGSADTSVTIAGINLLPDSGQYYYAVTTGLINVVNYANNPDGIDRSFAIAVYPFARVTAAYNTKNIDLQYFHSITDAPATTIRGVDQLQYLSKNNAYKTFNGGYRAQTGLDEVRYDVKDAVLDTLLFTAYGSWANYRGLAGLVFASGFLHPSNNQGGDEAMLFVAWPDGVVDSMGPIVNTGITEQLINEQTFTCYPNPATSVITIAFETKASINTTVEMTDVTGKSILVQSVKATAGKNEMTWNIANVPAGMYFIKVTTEGQQAIVQKLIIGR